MDEKLVGLILTLAVGVIMTGALLAPVVASYGYEESTYYNEGAFFAAVDDDTHTIVIDSTAITVDGDEIDQSLFPSGFTQYTIVYADTGFIRLDDYNVVVRNVYSGNIVDYTFTDETVTITIAGDAATITTTDGDASSTSLSSVNFYVAAAGDFVLSTTPVVNSDSEIYGAGQTTYTTDLPTSLNVYTVWSGDMDAVTATIVNYTSTSDWGACVVSDTTVNTTALDNDLYRVDSVVLDYTATYTSTSTDYDVTATYTYFLAPYAVSYDNPNYIGFGVSGLMVAIVVVILVAMIAAAAAAANRDRDL